MHLQTKVMNSLLRNYPHIPLRNISDVIFNIHTHTYTYTYIHKYIHRTCLYTYIKTHGSESRGQEEAGLRDEPVSYLQVAPL